MNKGKPHSNPQCFVTPSILDYDRIDCNYYDPRYFEIIRNLQEISRSLMVALVPLELLLDANSEERLTGGATPLGATYLTDGIPFIRVQNVREIGLDLSDVVFIGKNFHEGKLKRSQLQPKNVLLTITGYTYGISAIVPENIGLANINQHVVKIVVDKTKIVPKFLSIYLNSEYGKKQMDRAVTGGTRPALDYGSIKNLQILRPEITVQQDIVKDVKKIYDEANLIQEEISKIEASYDSIILSKLGVKLPSEPKLKIFLVSTQNHDRLEVKWHYPYYEEVIKIVKNFRFKKLREYHHKLKYGASIYADYVSDIPFLRIENLRRNHVDLSDLKYVPSGVYKKEVASLYLQEGDVLIGRSGSVGLCSYVPKEMENYVYGSYIIRLRINEAQILSRYLSIYLNSILGKIQFDRLKTGSSQFNINTQQIRDIIIIEPDLDIQEDIASTIFQLMNQVSTLKTRYQEKLTEAKTRFIELVNTFRKH